MPEPSFILETQAIEYLKQFHIAYPEHRLVRTPDEAASAAAQIGFPAVLKVVSPQVVHKSEAGGVAVGLGSAEEVRARAAGLLETVKKHVPNAVIVGLLVCAQAKPGVEVIVGGLRDAIFGPAVMVGLGGIFTEVLKDVAFRVHPLSEEEALKMLGELKGFPLLTGARGRPAVDLKALAQLAVSVGRLMHDCPEVAELDLNPVLAYPEGLMPVDARLALAEMK